MLSKYSKLLFITGALILLTGCSDQLGSEPSSTSQVSEVSQGYIEYSQTDFDFGEIKMSEGIVATDFTLENKGSQTVSFIKGESSCMCTEGVLQTPDGTESDRIKMHKKLNDLSAQSLAPGEKATLTAYFDPNAHGPEATGPIIREIRLFTNSSRDPIIQLRFKGNVIK